MKRQRQGGRTMRKANITYVYLYLERGKVKVDSENDKEGETEGVTFSYTHNALLV